jgi:hypothetical protein
VTETVVEFPLSFAIHCLRPLANLVQKRESKQAKSGDIRDPESDVQ